jgi:PKD repeat protein
MTDFGAHLYAGASGAAGSGCRVYRSTSGTSWAQVGSDGFGDTDNQYANAMVTFGGYLYVSTVKQNSGAGGAEIWRSSDGSTWSQANTDGFGDANNWGIYSLGVFGEHLYAGTRNDSTGCELWRSTDGTTWTQANTDGFGDTANGGISVLYAWGGALYAGTKKSLGGCELWKSTDGTTWSQVNQDGFGSSGNTWLLSLGVHGGYLYAGTRNPSGAQLHRSSDGEKWNSVTTNAFGDANNTAIRSLKSYGGRLYVGADNSSAGTELWRTGTNTATLKQYDVTKNGFGDSNNEIILSMNDFGTYFYVGLQNATTGVELWRSTDGATWSQANSDAYGYTSDRGGGSVITPFGGHMYVDCDGAGGTGTKVLRSVSGTTWSQVNTDGFGDTANQYTDNLLEFGNNLYAGIVRQTPTAAPLFRSSDGTTWAQCNTSGFSDANNIGIFSTARFGGYLYASTRNTTTGTEIWRSSDGTTWTQVNTDGFGDANNTDTMSMHTWGGYLYVGTSNYTTGGELWRTNDGATWTQANSDGFGSSANVLIGSISSFGSYLYAGTANTTTGSQCWKSSDGTTWTQLIGDGLGNVNNQSCRAIRPFGQYLYLTFGAALAASPAKVTRFAPFEPPTASGSTSPSGGTAPLKVEFTGSGTVGDGEIALYEWDFENDGVYDWSSAAGGNTSHTYTTAGAHTAKLRVTDIFGHTNTTTVTITVTSSVSLSLTAGSDTTTITDGGTVNFTASASGGTVVSYEWDFDGDGIYDWSSTSTGNTAYTYLKSGSYTAKLRVRTDTGLSATDTRSITVNAGANPPTISSFTSDLVAGNVPLTVVFSQSASDNSAISYYLYDFEGDGVFDLRTSTSTSATHTYEKVGTFTARLRVVDDTNRSADGTLMITTDLVPSLKVWMSTPKTGNKVNGSEVSVRANTAPGDLTQSVQLQYKLSTSSTWTDMGSAQTPPPYSFGMVWDVSSYTDGDIYNLRAVATDTFGKTVTSPSISVTVETTVADSDIEEGLSGGKHQKRQILLHTQTERVRTASGSEMITPYGSISTSDTAIVKETGANALPVNGSVAGLTSAERNVQFSFDSGATPQRPITIRMPYADTNDDGTVDGTSIDEDDLEVHWYDTSAGKWKRTLRWNVDKKNNFVEAETAHLTDFGIFANVVVSAVTPAGGVSAGGGGGGCFLGVLRKDTFLVAVAVVVGCLPVLLFFRRKHLS